ncbi:MAG: nucleotide exchange factor GrpE [Planctomycetota bacterium]|jgi:molecular chaperone GrpE
MKQKDKEKAKDEHAPVLKKSEREELRRQIDDLQAERDDILAKLQRVGADYANFQKRVPKQIADTIAYEKENIIKTLLPALDNLEHTLQNANAAEDVDVLVKGIRIIYDQTLNILKSHGVEQIKALDENFDPSVHEAVMQREEQDRTDNTVVEEFQKGYKLNGRVIRPSKVVVNKLPSEQTAEQKETEHATEQEKAPPEEETDEYETTDTE